MIAYVTPDTKATKAKTPMTTFFHTTKEHGVMSLFHRHTVSTMAGRRSPMMDKQMAPTNSMKSSSLGTALAMPTVEKKAFSIAAIKKF